MNNNNQPQGGKLAANIDIRTLPDLVCDACESEVFINGFLVKKVSPLLSDTGKPAYIPLPTFVCFKCGHVNSEVNPLKTSLSTDSSDDSKK